MVAYLKQYLKKKGNAKLFTLIIFHTIFVDAFSQEIIYMAKEGGVYTIPCEVNDLKLKFIFDTGASDVSISLSEAMFMLKNGYLSENDFIGSNKFKIANGDIVEGTTIVLRKLKIGSITLYNIQASIVHSMSSPLLLGQSALKKLGRFSFDYSNNTLALGGKDYTSSVNNNSSYTSPQVSNNNSYNIESNVSSKFNSSISVATSLKTEGNLKTSASPYSTVIKIIPKGAAVRVSGKEDDYWITSFKGDFGYLHEMYLNITYPMSLLNLPTEKNSKNLDLDNYKFKITTTTTLKSEGKLKDEDFPSGKILKDVPKDSKVTVIGIKGDYWIVFYDGKTGFLHDMYLNMNENMESMRMNFQNK